MARADKLLESMRANPRDWRIEDVATLCAGFGIACMAPRKGSHYKVAHHSMTMILTIPAHRPIKPVYIHSRPGAVRRCGSGIRRMNPHAFEVDIRPLPDADGGGFEAVVPELPGCRSDGDTPQAALDNAYDAIACWIEAAIELGRDIPQPRRAAA